MEREKPKVEGVELAYVEEGAGAEAILAFIAGN